MHSRNRSSKLQGLKGEPSNKIGSRNRHQLGHVINVVLNVFFGSSVIYGLLMNTLSFHCVQIKTKKTNDVKLHNLSSWFTTSYLKTTRLLNFACNSHMVSLVV